MIRNISEKELALTQILKRIEFLEEQIEDTMANYYIPFPVRVNGITVNTSIFNIMQSIKSSYKNVVLKDFYNEVDSIESKENNC